MTKSYDYHFIRPSTAKLQSRTLDDQCWYHGKIKRVLAQGLLKNDGDFLVKLLVEFFNVKNFRLEIVLQIRVVMS